MRFLISWVFLLFLFICLSVVGIFVLDTKLQRYQPHLANNKTNKRRTLNVNISANIEQYQKINYLSRMHHKLADKQIEDFFVNKKKDWCPPKSSRGGEFILNMYNEIANYQPVHCHRKARVGPIGDGGKILCTDKIKVHNCVVYSAGSRLDFSFEIDLIKKFACEVHTFDCTVGKILPNQIPPNITFHPWCLGGQNQRKTISSDLGFSGKVEQYFTLHSIMHKLGHSTVDILKMDIERHEFSVFDSLDELFAPEQIVFETHIHDAYGMWKRSITQSEWDQIWKKIHFMKYFTFSYEPNPLCLCCCEFGIIKHRPPKNTDLYYTKTTIVTAYFDVPSKHSRKQYYSWMQNFFSLKDAMVVFTSPDLYPVIANMRKDHMRRTQIITMHLNETLMFREYGEDFWIQQHNIDPEQKIHKDYYVYVIWNEKLEFLQKAVAWNFFQSSYFAWFDIGYFRTKDYNNVELLKKIPNSFPTQKVVFLDLKNFVTKSQNPTNGNYVGAGFIGGYADALYEYHRYYYKTLYQNKNKFIGKEQTWMSAVCRHKKEICFFIDSSKSKKDPWFYMSEYIFENNQQNKNYEILTFYKKCAWKPLATIFNGSVNVLDSKHQKDYALLSKFYLENTKRGFFTGALISGSLRYFYLTGHFSDDATDMDIDLSGGEYKHQTPYKLANTIPNTNTHLSWDSTNFTKYGVCECFLPNNMPFLCIRDVELYLTDFYGISWWVPIPGMKDTVMNRSEKTKKYLAPVLESLQKYTDFNGKITANSLYFMLVISDHNSLPSSIKRQIVENRLIFKSYTFAKYTDAAHEMNDLLLHIKNEFNKLNKNAKKNQKTAPQGTGEPPDEEKFWQQNQDRQFMVNFYPKLSSYKYILDIGSRKYNTRCKDLIASPETKYYQLEPNPPQSKMNNDGLLETTMQEAHERYPNFENFFDVILDFGVLGWGKLKITDNNIAKYINNVENMLKPEGMWVLKIDKDCRERFAKMRRNIIQAKFIERDFDKFKTGISVGDKKTVHFFFKKPAKNKNLIDPYTDFRENLFSDKFDPISDADCAIVVSHSEKAKLYDKIEKRKDNSLHDVVNQKCPKSRTRYDNGILYITSNENGIFYSTEKLDLSLKSQIHSGIIAPVEINANWQYTKDKKIKLDSEYVRVRYDDNTEETFIAPIPFGKKQQQNAMLDLKRPNILLLVLDNISRQAATWYLPKTVQFLRQRTTNTFVYNRMGSTGHSTAPSMTPILTGKAYDMDLLDRERVRTRIYKPTGIVDSELLTTIAHNYGYITSYGTDQDHATFLGCYWWNRSWFDHVMPPPAKAGSEKTRCIGQYNNHQHGFEYIRKLWDIYEKKRNPVFSYYHASHGHSMPHKIGLLDSDIVQLLQDALDRKTAVFLIGDHGPYAQFQSKLPFASILLDDSLAAEINIQKLAINNQVRLTSQYDLYKTLRFLIAGKIEQNISPGLNLFLDGIPRNRTCKLAGIPDFRCICSQFHDVDELPKFLLDKVQREINLQGHAVAPLTCSYLSVSTVSNIRRMVTCLGMSRFHFSRECSYENAPHQEVQWMLDFQTSNQQIFVAHIFTSRVGIDSVGKEIPLENDETDADRDSLDMVQRKTRENIVSFQTMVNSIQIKQITRYKEFESCTPPQASAQFCVCTENHIAHNFVPNKNDNQIENLLFVAHPDDEVVFFGNHINNNSHVIIITDGNSHGTGKHRQDVFKRAMSSIPVNAYELWTFPESAYFEQDLKKFWNDTILNTLQQKIENTIKYLHPKRIFTHNKYGEYGHINHREIHIATLAAFRNIFNCTNDIKFCASTQKDIPSLSVFYPELDYKNTRDRLKHLPQICEESENRKKLLDIYVKNNALTIGKFRKLCLKFYQIYPHMGVVSI